MDLIKGFICLIFKICEVVRVSHLLTNLFLSFLYIWGVAAWLVLNYHLILYISFLSYAGWLNVLLLSATFMTRIVLLNLINLIIFLKLFCLLILKSIFSFIQAQNNRTFLDQWSIRCLQILILHFILSSFIRCHLRVLIFMHFLLFCCSLLLLICLKQFPSLILLIKYIYGGSWNF